MGLLTGKTALIFGVANDHSIAWGIAQAFHRQGARLAFSYAGEALLKRVRPLADSVGSSFVEPCDVGQDDQVTGLFEKARAELGQLDILIHAIAFANRDELNGPYYNTSREGFRLALDVSCYSFTALVRAALPLMRPGGACLTLSYYGAEKAVPHYNVMGVAKAALEASVRYLAVDIGPMNLRVNAISAGPIRTLAAGGVAGFKALYGEFRNIAPLRRNVTIEDVGNAALYLCSDLAAGVTGEVHYVDAGFNVMGVPTPEPKH
jgi:enoyl-[acyl-carrier protein] reductase I